ncbi:hypothetical protein C5T94_02220 [Raoultella ornithinolytica]|nr:hypothetical protein C5T92_24690 [Raoultella ornithinolytica]PQH39317.1 hypothetical protein C5T94_02220 [Raoultella ornithinolytica]
MKFSTPDFMHCSRRTLMLFVLSANVVGWIVIIALIWAGCEDVRLRSGRWNIFAVVGCWRE